MNDRSRAPVDCFTLGELQLLSAIYHHLSRSERKRRSPKEKQKQLNGYEVWAFRNPVQLL